MKANFWGAVMPATLLAAPALAGPQGPLDVASRIFVEQRAAAPDGTVRTTLVPARKAVPGDRVVFVLAYRNTGAQPIGDVVLDNPVPAGVAYRAAAEGSAAPELSTDGRTFGPLAALRVALPGGGSRAATGDDVRHVRWRVPGGIPAGAQGKVAFQAVLK